MANCTYADVRLVVDTGLTDANLTTLIGLADAEMTARGLIVGASWTANLLKSISMYLTASMASANDARSMGKDGYMVTSMSLPKWYRQQAEDIIKRASLPAMISYNEPIPDEEDE